MLRGPGVFGAFAILVDFQLGFVGLSKVSSFAFKDSVISPKLAKLKSTCYLRETGRARRGSQRHLELLRGSYIKLVSKCGFGTRGGRLFARERRRSSAGIAGHPGSVSLSGGRGKPSEVGPASGAGSGTSSAPADGCGCSAASTGGAGEFSPT